MTKTIHEFEIDYGPVVQGFNYIKQEVNAVDENINGLSNDTKKAFNSMQSEARKYGKEVGDLVTQNQKVFTETKNQVEIIRQLTAARKKSNDPAEIANYNKQIEDARNKIRALNAEQKKGAEERKKDTKETLGLIASLLNKEKNLTDARNKSNDPALIKRYNKLIDETKNKLNDLTNGPIKQPGFFQQGIGAVFGGNLLFTGVQKVKDAFRDMVQEQIAFDKQLKNLSAITGASGKDLVFYGEKAIQMGQNIEGGAVAAVEAYKLIGNAKPDLLKNKEALVEVTDAAITLSQASGLTLPESARNLGTALNAFDESAERSTKFINVFAAAAQLGAQEIPFLTEALSKFGGIAKNANISIEESASAIEILGAKIPQAEMVGTNLRNILITMQTRAAKQGRPFKSIADELDLLAPKVKDVTFLSKEFDDRNLLAIQTLITQRAQLRKLTQGVTDTNSAFEQAAINTDTLAQSLLITGNAYDNLLLSIKGSKGIIKTISDDIGDAFRNLGEIIAGTAKENQVVRDIQTITGANKQLAETVAGLHIEYQQLNADAEFVRKFGDIAKNANKEEIERIRSITAYAQGLQMAIHQVKDSNSAEIAAARIKAILSTQAQLLKDQNDKGSLSLQDYTAKLKILTLSLTQAVIPALKKTEEAAQGNGVIEKLQAEITRLTDARTKSISLTEISSLNIQIKAKQEELDRLLGKENEKLKRAKEEFQRAIDDLRKKAGQAQNEQLTGQARIDSELKFQEEELQIAKDHFIKLGKAVNSNYKMSAEQEEQFQIILNQFRKKAADESIKLEVERQAEINKQRQQFNENAIEALNQEETFKINVVEGVRKPKGLNNFKERDFEEAKQRQILDIQEQYAQRRLGLKQNSLQREEEAEKEALQKQLVVLGNANDEDTNAKRAKIQSDLSLLEERYDQENKKIQNEVTKIINDIQQKRDQLNKAKPFNLAEFFGVSEEQLNSTLSAINQIGGYTQDAIDSYYDLQNKLVDAEIQKNEALAQEREKNISNLQSQLDKEQQLGDEGKANNQSRLREQINIEEQARQENLRNEKKAKLEKAKLAKDQLIADTFVQASNLAVAATQIYATVAKDAYTTALATGVVAAMIASFAIAKTNAFKAANADIAANKFSQGVIDLKGPGTETSDSINAKLSKHESVMTAKETKENKTLFTGIREDDDAMMKRGILNLIKNKGISLSEDLPETISMKKEVVRQNEINAYLQTDNAKLEKKVDEMKDLMSMMLVESRKETYNLPGGDLVRKSGNHTVIIKK